MKETYTKPSVRVIDFNPNRATCVELTSPTSNGIEVLNEKTFEW